MDKDLLRQAFSSGDLKQIRPFITKKYIRQNPDVIFFAYIYLPKRKKENILLKMRLNGADFNHISAASPSFCDTLLARAVSNGDFKMISFLLKNGAQKSIFSFYNSQYSNLLWYVRLSAWWKNGKKGTLRFRTSRMIEKYAQKELERSRYEEALEAQKRAERIIRAYQKKHPLANQKTKE